MSVQLRIVLILLLLSSGPVIAQISPGDLTRAHSELEGMGNCTLCHELGAQVSDTKCLDCHTEIKSLIRQDRGLHANPQVERQNCFQCHSEHHGRNFDMVRFNTNSFDHNRTGYTLEGAHKSVDCKSCHSPENIRDPQIRNRKDTYLGLDTQCISCHDDYHQGTLSTNCLDCHNMNAFSPVQKFDHDRADFKLELKTISNFPSSAAL